jgi:hypothetical protein
LINYQVRVKHTCAISMSDLAFFSESEEALLHLTLNLNNQ